MRFAHLGVYVADLASAAAISKVCEAELVGQWAITEAGLAAQEYDFAGIKIEFLRQTGRNQLGIDHVAFATDKFDQMKTRLLEAGAVEERQVTGNSGQRISFFVLNNLRIELIEN
ncbi:MAG: hypothetical protein GX058_02810 [Firmicutes bacterium]|nr:hypothetical protein [Bacillota bacterium]